MSICSFKARSIISSKMECIAETNIRFWLTNVSVADGCSGFFVADWLGFGEAADALGLELVSGSTFEECEGKVELEGESVGEKVGC